MQVILPNWPASKTIKAFASTRCDGFSRGAYQGLNLGCHVGDDLSIVQKNRDCLIRQTDMPSAPVWLNQTHSTLVVEQSLPTDQVLDADGISTHIPGVVCSVMTADCLPVLLTNVQGTQVSAVHAGWRGLANGIIENAIDQFDGQVMAWIGPAIGPSAFEVGEDVRNAFVSALPAASEAFVLTRKQGKWLANMNLLVQQRLNRAGVEQVYFSNLCTYTDPQRFYSYRRDGVTGRQASFIWIDN